MHDKISSIYIFLIVLNIFSHWLNNSLKSVSVENIFIMIYKHHQPRRFHHIIMMHDFIL